LLEQADAFFSEGRADEALLLAKQYLCDYPEDASAHYLLGACYRAVTPPWLTLAEGELGTALACFRRTGRRGALSRFDSDHDFELAVHRGRALIGIAWLREAMDRGLRGQYLAKLAGQCLEHVREGLRLAPGHPELREMQVMLETFVEERPPPRPALPGEGIVV